MPVPGLLLLHGKLGVVRGRPLGGRIGFTAGGLVHYNFGDSEVVMIFYFVMGLALAAERFNRPRAEAQEA